MGWGIRLGERLQCVACGKDRRATDRAHENSPRIPRFGLGHAGDLLVRQPLPKPGGLRRRARRARARWPTTTPSDRAWAHGARPSGRLQALTRGRCRHAKGVGPHPGSGPLSSLFSGTAGHVETLVRTCRTATRASRIPRAVRKRRLLGRGVHASVSAPAVCLRRRGETCCVQSTS